jgi:hypothetical protein
MYVERNISRSDRFNSDREAWQKQEIFPSAV